MQKFKISFEIGSFLIWEHNWSNNGHVCNVPADMKLLSKDEGGDKGHDQHSKGCEDGTKHRSLLDNTVNLHVVHEARYDSSLHIYVYMDLNKNAQLSYVR